MVRWLDNFFRGRPSALHPLIGHSLCFLYLSKFPLGIVVEGVDVGGIEVEGIEVEGTKVSSSEAMTIGEGDSSSSDEERGSRLLREEAMDQC